MQCDECQYKCLLNIRLKKHKKAVHEVQENDLKYNCEKCAFATNYLLHLWEHREQKHPDQTPTFHPRSKDMALALLAEQNIDLIEEFESFKKGIKGAFLEFADDMGSCLETLRKDLKSASNETATKVTELGSKIDEQKKEVLDLLRNQMSQSDKKEEVAIQNSEEKKDKSVKNDNEVRKPLKVKKTKDTVKNVAWIGTSISKVLEKKKFENENNVKLKVFKAYSIAGETETAYPKEKIRYPERNFKKVVPEVLDDDDIDVVILQTGSIEISNINVNEAVMDTTQDIESYKKK